MSKPGLYVVMYYAAAEHQQASGDVTVRLGFVVQVNTAAAQIAGLTYALEAWPPERGYAGHGAHAEPAPVEWLKEVLPLVEQVEPAVLFEPVRSTARAAVAEVAEEWPDKL